jgi:hypothetical protein
MSLEVVFVNPAAFFDSLDAMHCWKETIPMFKYLTPFEKTNCYAKISALSGCTYHLFCYEKRVDKRSLAFLPVM